MNNLLYTQLIIILSDSKCAHLHLVKQPSNTVFLCVVIATIIIVAAPTHSHVFRRDSTINELCGDQRLYFEKTGKCYPAKRQGPCGELMVMETSAENKNIGECNCDFMHNLPVCPQRPKVFWEEKSRCYYIYEQGPCEKDEWVVPHEDGTPSCENIPCLENYNARLEEENFSLGSNTFVFPHEGECYRANGLEPNLCSDKQFVFFRGEDSANFYCSDKGVCGLTFTRDTNCPDGSSPDFQGGCEPAAAF